MEGLGGDPWCKAAAVDDGLTRASGDTLILHDADVLVPNLAEAVETLEAGAPWVVPHRLVHRLNREATGMVLDGADPQNLPCDEDPYHGWPGGGVIVVRRADWERTGFDPRHEGWGLEDACFAMAADELVGPHVRMSAPLWHLWHPPQQRMTRRFGSAESEALWRRYRRARGRPGRMAALIAEGRQP